jgi:23S rRNA (pseudouridine1915-N3)-methyltransferase
MRIKLIVIGKVKEPWINQGIQEYLKRLNKLAKVELIVLKDKGLKKEAKEILSKIDDEFVIVLGEEGKHLSSHELSQLVRKAERDMIFVIGSAEGLDNRVKERADLLLSLSDMTFTHEIARLLLVEQIYRAFTIIKNIKYHR